MSFDTFAIYEFAISYPDTWTIELNPRSEKMRGDVAFKSEQKDAIFVSWRPLDEAFKKFNSLKRLADDWLKTTIAQMAKNVQTLEYKEILMNDHEAYFAHVKRTIEQQFLLKTHQIEQELMASHLFCKETNRYFIIYVLTPIQQRIQINLFEIFHYMIHSFRCHTCER
jgi:hypothetical protein